MSEALCNSTTQVPAAGPTDSLAKSLANARVVVCAGTGGVGKTTIAAALAVRAATHGRRTLVLTIDPARRLADALGIDQLCCDPTPVALPQGDGSAAPAGSLDAMMLDPKPTFDRLVHRLTEDPAARARILENRIYRHLSEALAGSAEYAAMEQVREAVESGLYDLVVVDTPPASHALDFLTAPRRLRQCLEGRFVQALVRPAMSASRFGFKIFGQTLHKIMSLVDRVAGIGFLDDISEFLSAIDGLTDGFRDGTSRVEDILLGESTAFVLIGGGRAAFEPGALEFLDALEDLDVRLHAVILNRIAPWPHDEPAGQWLKRDQSAALDEDIARLTRALEQTSVAIEPAKMDADLGTDPPETASAEAAAILAVVRQAAQARADADESCSHLDERIQSLGLRCHLVSERSGDVDRLSGLLGIADELFGEASA